LEFLAVACNQTVQKTYEDLDKALRGEYIIQLDDVHFKFVHDRVQQAALALVSYKLE
jgi:predicted ATPase